MYKKFQEGKNIIKWNFYWILNWILLDSYTTFIGMIKKTLFQCVARPVLLQYSGEGFGIVDSVEQQVEHHLGPVLIPLLFHMGW